MADHYALGLASAARGVLQEGDVIRLPRGCDPLAALACQLGYADDAGQARDLRLDQPGKQLGLRHGNQHFDLGVAQDAGLAAQMVLDLRKAQRWVDGHRNTTGQENAEKAMKEVAARGQHQGYGMADLQATALQPCGNGQGALVQGAIAYVLRLVAVAQQAHVGLLRLMAHLPLQHLDQGSRGVRRLLHCYQSLAQRQRACRFGATLSVQYAQYIGGSFCRSEQAFR
ncbi:hypothetical protein D3C76_1049770 [compost metagenome]